MRRTQVQFDDETYDALKRAARERQTSMSQVLRQLVREHLRPRQQRPWRYEDLTFVASGSSGLRPGDALYRLSEHHDEAWAEDLLEEFAEDARR